MATAAILPAAVDRPGPNLALITIAVMLATIMQVLDSTIANVALPHMQASLGAARDTVTWVLTSYIVASAVALPLTGWIADRIGPKRLFLIGIAGFVIASMLCGLAQSLAQMILFRVVQGVFGAFLLPLSQSIMLDSWPRARHGQAMALWGMGIMLGPVMGPLIGGWLTENFDWRWVFFINLPVGLVAFFLSLATLTEKAKRIRRFDLFGFALLAVGVGALQLMLDRGDRLDWFESPEILFEAGLAISALWAFAVHTATARDPIFELAFFRDRNFLVSMVFMFLLGIMLFSSMALLPPMLQTLYGYPVLTAGIVVAPRGVGTLIAMGLGGYLAGRIDPRHLVATGIVLTAWSLYMMTGFSLEMDAMPVVVSGFVQGIAFGLMMVPLNLIAFATLDPDKRTDASSLYSLVRNVGSSIGISIVTFLLARNLQTSHADMAAHVTPFSLPVDPTIARQFGAVGDTALAMLDAEANRQALMIAYLDDFQLQFWGALAMLPLVLLLRKPRGPVDGTVAVGE